MFLVNTEGNPGSRDGGGRFHWRAGSFDGRLDPSLDGWIPLWTTGSLCRTTGSLCRTAGSPGGRLDPLLDGWIPCWTTGSLAGQLDHPLDDWTRRLHTFFLGFYPLLFCVLVIVITICFDIHISIFFLFCWAIPNHQLYD